jgi:hypothetical protein
MHLTDPEMIMPPPNRHKTMKPSEFALIERWIVQGAEISDTEKRLSEREKASQEDYATWLNHATVAPDQRIDSTLHLHLSLTESTGPLRGFGDGKPREWS